MSRPPLLMKIPLHYFTISRPLFSLLRIFHHSNHALIPPPLSSNPFFSFNNPNFSSTHFFSALPRSASSISPSSSIQDSLSKSTSLPKRSKKERHESPEFVLKLKLEMCSKHNDLDKALRLYKSAQIDGTTLSVQHYNLLLYLCSLSAANCDDSRSIHSLEKGFEIYTQMCIDNVVPNEATFTSLSRLAAAKQDPEMAFDFVKKMKNCGIWPKLRSYGPPLFGFCEKGDADGAYNVDAHMVECGVMAEEDELCALLKVSVNVKRGDKVYELLHRLRANVRQVSEETARVIEDWFVSEVASVVGIENWDVGKVKKGVVKGGGGWHGQGWLGSGKWRVVKAEMDKGVCSSCAEKLVCIDIDPKETESFASSLSSLACEKEKRANFMNFQEWLRVHGPYDAVVDGANVGLMDARNFNFRQLINVVNQLQRLSPSKKLPLVILHQGRVNGGVAENPNTKRVLARWRSAGALYATPRGSNDDWYWLYAAVSNKCLLVTNDEMRDHLFQLLGNTIFPRWKEKHQVRMTVSTSGVALHMPPPYSIVVQESETGSWHIPTVIGDDLETPREWLCATRASKTKS